MNSQDLPNPGTETPETPKAPMCAPGFSLVEVLIVLALIALLAGLAVTNLSKFFASGNEKAATIFVTSSLELPMQSYRLDIGSFPTKLDDLLVNPGKGNRWKGPYIKDKLLDPWGNKYEYRVPPQKNVGGDYDLWSKGPDGQSGTQDDIGNWKS